MELEKKEEFELSVREIAKNKYRIEIPIAYIGSKRKRHVETLDNTTLKQAKLREAEIKLELTNNNYIKKINITFEQLLDEWLKMQESKLAIKTYKNYVNYSKRIKDSIGYVKLKDINPRILEGFYNDLRTNTTYADKTIKHYYTLINTVLSTAVKWDYIKTNPNTKVDKIIVKKKQGRFYTPEQVAKLVNALESESLKYKVLIILAIDTGCRRGELTGLEWNDIDFEKGIIYINKTTQYVAGIGTFEKGTKGNRGYTSDRKIHISKTTKELLLEFKEEQSKLKDKLGELWQGSKRIFTTDWGADMHPNTPSAILTKILERNKLDYINFHGLRHTSISLQIELGIQPQVISKRAGHSNLNTTHSIYSHFFESSFEEVPEKIDAFLHAST
ncbi:MAG: site-specific integrase [Clostridia bacterium]|nr:site-specific integrase [Clostridia bacterium]